MQLLWVQSGGISNANNGRKHRKKKRGDDVKAKREKNYNEQKKKKYDNNFFENSGGIWGTTGLSACLSCKDILYGYSPLDMNMDQDALEIFFRS